MDRGQYGVFRTIKVLNENGINYNGTFVSQKDRDSLRIFDIKGIKVAFLAYSYGTNGNIVPGQKTYLINRIDFDLIQNDVRNARMKKVDIVGGGLSGLSLGYYLSMHGKKVTIVEKSEQIGEGMAAVFREHLIVWFKKKDVTVTTGVKEYVEINDKGLTIINKEGQKQTIEADTIVTALPLVPDITLFRTLEKKVPEVYAIGDCKEPALIADAIGTGLRTAIKV